MAERPWGDAATEPLLALASQLLANRDTLALPLIRLILARECGEQFARSVVTALEAGTPPTAFPFLPPPREHAPPPSPAPDPAPASPTPAAAPGPTRSLSSATRSVATRRAFQQADPLPTSGYASVVQVAAHFGVSVKAVYRWMASGRIQAERRPGGSYRIPVEQFRYADSAQV